MDEQRITKEARRLQPLAERVLRRYPFLTREVEHLATHSNVMYRVVTQSGEQLVLRVGTPHANTRANIDFEVAWLDAIARDTDLNVVAPLRTAGGALIVDEHDPDLGEERPCVLFTWVPGAPLGEGAGTFGYRLLGQMSASLQRHGRTWAPPSDEMRRWDRVFYYDAERAPVVIDDPLYGHLFDAPRRKTLHTASELATTVLEETWAAGAPQVVHGDLHEWNVHLSGSRLHAFDFEDVMMAMPAQDAAICLFHTRGHRRRDEIRAAFRTGFEDVAPWPIADDRQLDGIHAARQILLMNYAAKSLPMVEAREYLSSVAIWLDDFLKRYA